MIRFIDSGIKIILIYALMSRSSINLDLDRNTLTLIACCTSYFVLRCFLRPAAEVNYAGE